MLKKSLKLYMIYNNYMRDLEIFIYKIRGVLIFKDNKIKYSKNNINNDNRNILFSRWYVKNLTKNLKYYLNFKIIEINKLI